MVIFGLYKFGSGNLCPTPETLFSLHPKVDFF